MFTQYIDRFLNLLERFVVATERRNEIMAKTSGTTLAQDVKTAEDNVAKSDSAETSTGGRGRGRGRGAVAGNDEAASDNSQAETQQDTGGRRQRVRANATEQQDAGTEGTAGATTGRRERKRATETKKEPEATKDTPEQADDRAEIESLCALAGDVDDAAAEVKEYFKSKGWNVATDIPSADLEDALADLNDIADKYFD